MDARALREIWEDILRYYRGDKAAWAYVNYTLNGVPYK